MERLPRCSELQRSANPLKWENAMILYCRRQLNPYLSAVGAVAGVLALTKLMPLEYKHMLEGPSLKVDLHTGAIAEGGVDFRITFVVLIIIIKGPKLLYEELDAFCGDYGSDYSWFKLYGSFYESCQCNYQEKSF
ncbi:aquaporin SIP1-2 [Tanacetum coccineum]